MKQKLSVVNTSTYDIRVKNRPEKHIRERITFDTREDAYNFIEEHGKKGLYYGSGIPIDKNGNSYIIKDHFVEPTFENKANLRLSFCQNHRIYTVCACCGKELQDNQKENHTVTKWGIIGPECIKKVMLAGIEI